MSHLLAYLALFIYMIYQLVRVLASSTERPLHLPTVCLSDFFRLLPKMVNFEYI